ncbi:MAG: hypothetical protein ACTSQJ_14755 [Promethearchaeota archaeon]
MQLSSKLLLDIRKNLFFNQEKKYILNFIILIYIIIAILLTYVITDFLITDLFKFKINIILIFFLIFIPSGIFSSIYFKNQQISSKSKEFFSSIWDYNIPILLSILSIYILMLGYGKDISNLSTLEIVQLQQNSRIDIFKIVIPAFFIIINPFAAIAYLTGIIGIFRTYRHENYINNELNQKIFTKILRNVSFFFLISLFLIIFIGGGGVFFIENIFINLLLFIFIYLVFTFFIALIDSNRPKLFIERKILNYFNVPIIFSLLAIFYSLFLLYFNII